MGWKGINMLPSGEGNAVGMYRKYKKQWRKQQNSPYVLDRWKCPVASPKMVLIRLPPEFPPVQYHVRIRACVPFVSRISRSLNRQIRNPSGTLNLHLKLGHLATA